MRLRWHCIFLAALLSVVITGCNDTDAEQKAIAHVLSTRAAALNSRDLTGYVSIISPRYNDKGKTFQQLKEKLAADFRDYERLSYTSEKPDITITGNQAETTGTYRMKIRIRGKEFEFSGTEHLKLAKEPDGWKIIAGM